jgi:hypothetical protein
MMKSNAHLKKFLFGGIFILLISGQLSEAQLLSPRELNYERTGRTSVGISWLAPNSDQFYPLYGLTDWIPVDYFNTQSASPKMQDCVISDGKFIYSASVDNAEGQFMKFDLNGNFLETVTIPGLPLIYKMAYDGTYFYATQYGKPGIYQLDMDKKERVAVIPTAIDIYHICYIPTLDNGKGGFEIGNPYQGYYFSKDGAYLSDGPLFTAYNGCTSSAWFDGKLYAFCQPDSLRTIVEYDVKTALPTGKYLDLSTLKGKAGIAESQMADDLNFYEYPSGTMNALVTLYYTTTMESGTITCFFEVGRRPLPAGLQGYNIYKDNVKQNTALVSSSVYAYKSDGLDEETDYSYQLTALYDGEESPGSQNLTVRLPASNLLPLMEDFSSGNYQSPNYWEINPSSNTSVWKITATTAGLGEYLPSLAYSYAYYRDYDQTFVSKPLKPASASPVKLRYDVSCASRGLTKESLFAEVQVDGVWQTVSTENSAQVSGWQTKEWDITSLVQGKEFRLRFRVSGASGSTSYYWYLDNIRVWEAEYVHFGGIVRSIDMPLSGATIRLAKSDDAKVIYETVSDANGNFLFPDVEKGIYLLKILKEDTEVYENTAYSIESENTNAFLIVPGSRMQIDTSPVFVSLSENKSKNIRLPVSNTGNGGLVWNADIRFEAFGTGDEIGDSHISEPPSWEATHPFDLANPRETALVFHNNHYFTIGDKSYNPTRYPLREYSATGELLRVDTIVSPDYIISGLVSDGTTLYEVTHPQDRGDFSASIPGMLVPIDRENHIADDSRAIVTDFNEIKGLLYAAYDPVHDGFYVGSSHVFYRIDRAGKVQKTYDGIIYSYARQIVLDTFSEGGPYLWLFCEKTIADYGGDYDQANILQFSLKDETMTNVIHSVMDIPDYDAGMRAVPEGFFGTTALIPGYFVLGGAVSFSNSVMKEKTSLFIYKMFPFKNWISLEEKSGKLAPGASGELSLNLNTKDFQEGDEMQAYLVIRSNAQAEDMEIPVKLTVDNSAETNCYAPQNLQAALTENYGVQLTWSLPAEAPQVKGYRVFRNGKSIHENLLANASFEDTIPGMGVQTYTVIAFYESGCESYDSEPVEIRVANPEIVAPVELTASIVNKKHVQLKWDIPRYGTGFYDDFESYPAFAVQDIGKWKVVDGDHSWTYYDQSILYPNAGNPMAFMVFNPAACSPPASLTLYDEKSQVLACFSANVDKLANDDWLISPELVFDRPFTFSFVAKTHNLQYGFEKINIGYSLTGNNPEDFIFINGNTPVNIGDVWGKYEYPVPAGTKYVAINCVTTNGFILFIDNIYIGYSEYYSGLLGYNVYRNNEKLNTALLETNHYVEPSLDNGTYTYEVEALFANGTASKAASTVVVDYSFEAMPPRELEAVRQDNKIQLTWLPPASADPQNLRYDNGTPYSSMGGIEEEQLIGVRWDGSDLNAYQGYSITGVQFHISEPVLYAVPFLYEAGELVFRGDEMQVATGKYTTFRLDAPVPIKPYTEYIIGYSYLTNGAGYYPVSHDAGPGVAWKGDLISLNGYIWYSAYQLWGEEFNVNWNIAMLIERNDAGEFNGYNLYRNDAKVNAEPLSRLNYTDEDDGLRKEYYVTAAYKTNGEKSSNHVIVSALGIKDANLSPVTVYPNPAKDRLFVKGEYDVLELVSLDGTLLRKIPFKGEAVTGIDIQNVWPGMYLLGVKKGEVTEYYKVIISR